MKKIGNQTTATTTTTTTKIPKCWNNFAADSKATKNALPTKEALVIKLRSFFRLAIKQDYQLKNSRFPP